MRRTLLRERSDLSRFFDSFACCFLFLLFPASDLSPLTSAFPVVYRHYDSDWEAGEYCVADYTLECATCGEEFWEADLESVDVPWFDQPVAVLLCEDCLAELQESEGFHKDFNAGERLRGQLEMALPVT